MSLPPWRSGAALQRPGASAQRRSSAWSMCSATGQGRDWRTARVSGELNAMLLALPLGVVAAMHLEGGPEASLSIHAPGIDLDLAGSYETGFLPRYKADVDRVESALWWHTSETDEPNSPATEGNSTS